MYFYYSRIPCAAVFAGIDGNRYAHIPHRIEKGAVFYFPESPRMVRVDNASFTKGGETYVYFGRMGDAIAQVDNLPFAVTAIKEGERA